MSSGIFNVKWSSNQLSSICHCNFENSFNLGSATSTLLYNLKYFVGLCKKKRNPLTFSPSGDDVAQISHPIGRIRFRNRSAGIFFPPQSIQETLDGSFSSILLKFLVRHLTVEGFYRRNFLEVVTKRFR